MVIVFIKPGTYRDPEMKGVPADLWRTPLRCAIPVGATTLVFSKPLDFPIFLILKYGATCKWIAHSKFF